MSEEQWGFNTRAVHVGQAPDPTTGATIPPLYLSTTYTHTELGRHRGYEYGRQDNPTREALEAVLAALEHGAHAVTFSSGMAAVDSVFRLCPPHAHVVVSQDVYGGVWRLLQTVYGPRLKMRVSYVDASDVDAVTRALAHPTQLVWIETPSNPLLKVADIQALADLAHRQGARLAVDNTFASPYLQNPLDWGADLVVHSTTKYLGGHSDAMGGAVVVRDGRLYQELRQLRNTAGATLAPFDAWLTLRGVKTLGVRMERHNENATRLAQFLQRHPRVHAVCYPGLADGQQQAVVRRQMRGFGGMLSFWLKVSSHADTVSVVRRVLARLQVFSLAESLGGVESLVAHPATMSHASLPPDERRARGIDDRLIRVSAGLEDYADLERDWAAALDEDVFDHG